MSEPFDILVTWPKSRTLESYLSGCARAKVAGDVVCFRVARKIKLRALYDTRCYRVYDGRVRGWLEVVETCWRNDVARVEGGPKWESGWYIICDPLWMPVPAEYQLSMRGFQGWRWFFIVTLWVVSDDVWVVEDDATRYERDMDPFWLRCHRWVRSVISPDGVHYRVVDIGWDYKQGWTDPDSLELVVVASKV